jgi:hypothetical protein
MLALPVSALRNHVRMLTKKQDILNGIRFPRGDNALLHRVCFGVADKSQIDGQTFRHAMPCDSQLVIRDSWKISITSLHESQVTKHESRLTH